MKVYIAGPYSGKLFDRIRHIWRAYKTAKEVIKLGGYPYTPHTSTMFMDDIASYNFFMDMHLSYLLHCHIILMMPGWEYSMGAQIEMSYALKLAIPIAYNLQDLDMLMRSTIEAA